VWASAWWASLRLAGVQQAWAWTGIALAAYAAAFPWFVPNIILGNINHLVLGLVVGFAVAYVRGHTSIGAVLLGLAIATKLWPALIIVPILRDRRWGAAGLALGTAAIATAVPILWLGLDSIGAIMKVSEEDIPILSTVLWTTAFRLWWDWWPMWGSVVIAAVLLLIPARGLPGIGLAMIAGIGLIPNIWDHYLPTLLVAMLFVGSGIPWTQIGQRTRDSFRTRRQIELVPRL
jgi:hypothetical protein